MFLHTIFDFSLSAQVFNGIYGCLAPGDSEEGCQISSVGSYKYQDAKPPYYCCHTSCQTKVYTIISFRE